MEKKFKEVKDAFSLLDGNERKNTEEFGCEKREYILKLIRVVIIFLSRTKNWDNLFVDTSITGIFKDCSRLLSRNF